MKLRLCKLSNNSLKNRKIIKMLDKLKRKQNISNIIEGNLQKTEKYSKNAVNCYSRTNIYL